MQKTKKAGEDNDSFSVGFKRPEIKSAMLGLKEALQSAHQAEEEENEKKNGKPKKKKKQTNTICCCGSPGCGIGPMTTVESESDEK